MGGKGSGRRAEALGDFARHPNAGAALLAQYLSQYTMTLDEFSERVGIHASTLGRYLRGNCPSLKNAICIERATRCYIPARRWLNSSGIARRGPYDDKDYADGLESQ